MQAAGPLAWENQILLKVGCSRSLYHLLQGRRRALGQSAPAEFHFLRAHLKPPPPLANHQFTTAPATTIT